MTRLLIELTNRCNLRCRHCYDTRHADTGHLAPALLSRILDQAADQGIDEVVFTGGEPTLHPAFEDLVRQVAAAGLDFGFVSNGITFPRVYPLLLDLRSRFRGVTFSLDGADAATHDRLRGRGSFRRVLQAASICVVKALPFSINMVVTTDNRHQLGASVALARTLGSRGLRFGHLVATADSPRPGLDIPLQELAEIEREVRDLAAGSAMPVVMAPGYYSEDNLFPCAPLNRSEFNLDYRGRMTLCCQLSGVAGAESDADVIADLRWLDLGEACDRFRQRVAVYRREKIEAARRPGFGGEDFHACRYCLKQVHGVMPAAAGVTSAGALRGGGHAAPV